MKFRNNCGHELDFELHGTRHVVPPHETCEIADRIAYAVATRGLPLTPVGPLPSQAAAPERAAVAPVDLDSEDGDDPPPFSEPAPSVASDGDEAPGEGDVPDDASGDDELDEGDLDSEDDDDETPAADEPAPAAEQPAAAPQNSNKRRNRRR